MSKNRITFGSAEPLLYMPGVQESEFKYQVTVDTSNPDIVDRLKQAIADLDMDGNGELYDTYVEIIKLGNGTAEHVWSAAFEPNEEEL